MPKDRNTLLATAIVVFTGALWGFYWLPVRRVASLALPGAWGTLAIVGAATLLLAPFAIRRRKRLAAARPLAVASVALGGGAFVFYSVGFAYGRVLIVILLFYLTPVWSTLIGRFFLGWKPSRLRVAAIIVGITGLAVMLGADGEPPIPRSLGEILGLLSGILWSIATTGMRTRSDLGPGEAAFIFALGASIGALMLAPVLEAFPSPLSSENLGKLLLWAIATGTVWWGLSMAGLMWATPRLVPARVGILLMSEVIVGTISAALLVNEQVGALELGGGSLVLLAGVLEIWPVRRTSKSMAT